MEYVGLGFRREIADDILQLSGADLPAFVEVAPENWMDIGGYWAKIFRQVTEKYEVTCHGLSLSIGGPDDVDYDFLKKVKMFLKTHNIQVYSEHISYSQCDNAHLYDLLPIPFREDAVQHIVSKIKQVQDYLEMPLVLENVSYYKTIAPEMSESQFISAIVKESCCKLLLDVNNVYVNAFNHGYDAQAFINELPLNQVAYIHMAGHLQVSEDLIIDTHGNNIIDPVFDLFGTAISKINEVPVLLERDFNFPEMNEIASEMKCLEEIALTHWKK